MSTLGEKCVEWCKAQMTLEPIPSRETLASWFAQAEREGQRLGVWLASEVLKGHKQNHCAISQCQALEMCTIEGLPRPHGFRASAKELMADAIVRGRWVSKAHISMPAVGDLFIYDRSVPGVPSTAWQGHVDRVCNVHLDSATCIGANEGPHGEWLLAERRYDAPRLLGYVSYAEAPFISEEDRAHVESLNLLGLDSEARSWERVV